MQDTDFTNIWDSNLQDRRPANGVAPHSPGEDQKNPLLSIPKTETDIVKLAARSVRGLIQIKSTFIILHVGLFKSNQLYFPSTGSFECGAIKQTNVFRTV
jgi:hypothetical protein